MARSALWSLRRNRVRLEEDDMAKGKSMQKEKKKPKQEKPKPPKKG